MISKKSFISITTFVFLIGLHFFTYGAVFALGTSGDIGLNTVKKDTQWRDVKQGITENPKIRTTVLENANKLSPQMLDDLLNDVKLRPKFFTNLNTSTFVGNSQKITTFKHTMSGIVENGVAKGFHHYPSRGQNTDIIQGTQTPIDKYGVYEARVKIEGVEKKDISSFFPDNMSQEEIARVVNIAYTKILDNKSKALVKIGRNEYQAIVDNYDVRIFLDNNNKIITTWPQYRP